MSRGVANGPVWRLIGTTAIGLLLLTFTPTKWAVQFGAFAGLAGALGAVTAFAFSRVGLHSRRNLALYVTALLFVLAWATSGINGWFYVGNYGVPWFDKQPVIASHPVTPMFLALAIATGLLAGWLHFRMDYTGHTEVADNRRNRFLASTPLLVVAVIMVVLEVGSMAKAAAQRYPVYTTAKANVEALTSGLSKTSCAMADDVLVEPDTNAGMLQPVPGQRFGQYGPLGGENPVGFTPNGIGEKLEPPEPVTANPGTVNSDGSPNKPNVGIGYAAGTDGGYGPVGVNGSRAFLPFGLDPARTPVMGSYNENTVAAKATSAWYQLPPRTPDRPLVVVAAAGADLVLRRGGQLQLRAVAEAAVGRAPAGRQLTRRSAKSSRSTSSPQNAWRNLRFPLAWAPPEANVARIVASDPNLSSDQWFGFTPPRVPILETAQAASRFADTGADGHRHRRELPVPAPVLRASRGRRTAGVPDSAQPQADGGVVEQVAVRRGRRPVPVHPGAAAHVDDPVVPAQRLVPRLGLDRTLRAGGARRRRHRTPSSSRAASPCAAGRRVGPIRALP